MTSYPSTTPRETPGLLSRTAALHAVTSSTKLCTTGGSLANLCSSARKMEDSIATRHRGLAGAVSCVARAIASTCWLSFLCYFIGSMWAFVPRGVSTTHLTNTDTVPGRGCMRAFPTVHNQQGPAAFPGACLVPATCPAAMGASSAACWTNRALQMGEAGASQGLNSNLPASM